MKPAPFDYAKPGALGDVFDLLDTHGDDARILAGGQSLLPTLNMRLSAPTILIDITGIDDLHGVSSSGGVLRIGALTTHAEVKASADVARAAPLLAQAMPHIAHPAIRNKGTFGGSLAHADPAAELPACIVALDASIELTSRSGTRTVAASDFFHGLYETDLKPGEILASVEIPEAGPGSRSGFSEFSRRSGDFAMSALAARARFDGNTAQDVRLAYAGVDIRPVRATAAEAVLEGKVITADLVAEAKAKLADDLSPPDDLHASGAMKLHLSGVLLERVMLELAGA